MGRSQNPHLAGWIWGFRGVGLAAGEGDQGEVMLITHPWAPQQQTTQPPENAKKVQKSPKMPIWGVKMIKNDKKRQKSEKSEQNWKNPLLNPSKMTKR